VRLAELILRLPRRRHRFTSQDSGDVLIGLAREAKGDGLDGAERGATLALTAVFVLSAIALNVFSTSHRTVEPVLLVALLAAFAVASRVEFEIGSGTAIPTQVAFVPMLMLAPAGLIPLLVLAGLLLGSTVEVLRGDRHFERVLVLAVSSSYSLGPALVLELTGEPALSWQSSWVYALAFVSASVVDLASHILHQLLAVGVRPSLQLRLMGEVVLVDAALAPVGILVGATAQKSTVALLAAMPFLGLLEWFARERRRRVDQALQLSQAYRGTALLLGDVVEADDAYTGSHSREVVGLVLDVADVMALDEGARQRAEFAALLHDVGKIRVPSAIVNKPGPLDDDEWAVMQRHTIEGEALLTRVGGLLGEVGVIVRSCHERWDGKGYPDGLLADDIPLVARIVAACDAYNAMTTDRPYRRALSEEQALGELRANAGTQFDPQVVRALIEVVSRTPAAPLLRREAA